MVYLAYASYNDAGDFHGWVLGYDAQTLQLLAAFNTTPNGSEGGIWQSGAGLAAGRQGDIYCLTGNGSFDPALGNYGDSFLKLTLTAAGLEVADYFTPYDQQHMADFDADLGSGGALLLPDSVGSPAHPHLLVGSGKEGTIYLVDRDNLGHFNPTNNSQIVQELDGAVTSTFSMPAYFNNELYYAAQGDFLKAFTFTNGLLVSSLVSQSLAIFGYPGATPAVSANATDDGIIWVLQTDTAPYGGRATLHAYDADDLSVELYNSSQAGSRDDPGGAIKFSVPTVANGKVYVAGASRLSVFGNGLWTPAPTLSPNGGVFTNSVVVNLGVASTDAEIHYTLDGTAATLDSPLFITPFTLTNSTVVRAIAIATNMLPSGEVIASFASAPPAVAVAGFGGNGAGWTLNGGASAANDVLTLTDGLPGESGSAFLNTRQIITNFEARFVRRAGVGASGAALVVQNSADGPTALSDGCLGYCGIAPSGAVVFDVETGSQGEAFTDTGYAANGTPGGYASTLPLDLGAGDPIAVTLKYDGSVLTEHLADLNTGLTYDTNYTVNLAAAVGGANTAFVGFTGASGWSLSVQTIESFTFGPVPIIVTPPSLTVTRVGDGITIAWGLAGGLRPRGHGQPRCARRVGHCAGTPRGRARPNHSQRCHRPRRATLSAARAARGAVANDGSMMMFPHIPKTGGTTFEFILGNGFGMRHCHLGYTGRTVISQKDLDFTSRLFLHRGQGMRAGEAHGPGFQPSGMVPDGDYSGRAQARGHSCPPNVIGRPKRTGMSALLCGGGSPASPCAAGKGPAERRILQSLAR